MILCAPWPREPDMVYSWLNPSAVLSDMLFCLHWNYLCYRSLPVNWNQPLLYQENKTFLQAELIPGFFGFFLHHV